MTAILTCNIQCGLGCDGVVDLARIARVAAAMGEADVLCFQEVARNDPQIAGGVDQLAELKPLFPQHRAFFGAALDRQGSGDARRQFGNLVLSRLPVLQVFRHLLPHPAVGGIKHMQRQAIEVVVETRTGALRIVTTHLEYYWPRIARRRSSGCVRCRPRLPTTRPSRRRRPRARMTRCRVPGRSSYAGT